LHERLGDSKHVVDASVEAYENAYRLGKQAGDPAASSLRRLSKLLLFELRFRGAVGRLRTVAEIEQQVAEAQAIFPDVDDDQARATFLTALAFLPWWLRNSGVVVDDRTLEEGEARGREAAALADRIGSVELRSASRDALGALSMTRGEWARSLAYALERLEFEEELELVERLDAHSVKARALAVIGELDECQRGATAALATVQPDQAPNWLLHLLTWRTYALTLLGRWDDATAAAERAREAWIGGGRSAAGYAQQGFASAIDVARGRRDAVLVEQWRDIMIEISAQFPEQDLPRVRMRNYANLELSALAQSLGGPITPSGAGPYERQLALCADYRQPIQPDVLARYLSLGTASGAVILEAQARRLLAIMSGDAGEAARAREIFGRIRAAPYEARALCEFALLTRDESALREGMAALESVGDIDQMERYTRWAEEER
jgi:tetratricopeptide (TPR) repeat protein